MSASRTPEMFALVAEYRAWGYAASTALIKARCDLEPGFRERHEAALRERQRAYHFREPRHTLRLKQMREYAARYRAAKKAQQLAAQPDGPGAAGENPGREDRAAA